MKKITLVGFSLTVCALTFGCRTRSDSGLAAADNDVTGGAETIEEPSGLSKRFTFVNVDTISNLTIEDWRKNCEANMNLAVSKAEASDPDIKAFRLPPRVQRGDIRNCEIAAVKKSDLKQTYYGFAERILSKGVFASQWNAGENIQAGLNLFIYNASSRSDEYDYVLDFAVTLRTKFKNSADSLPTYSYFSFRNPKVILSKDNVSAIGIKFIDGAFKDVKSPSERKDLENFNWSIDICEEQNRNLTLIRGDSTLELYQGTVTKAISGDVQSQAWVKFRPTDWSVCKKGYGDVWRPAYTSMNDKEQQVPLKPVN